LFDEENGSSTPAMSELAHLGAQQVLCIFHRRFHLLVVALMKKFKNWT